MSGFDSSAPEENSIGLAPPSLLNRMDSCPPSPAHSCQDFDTPELFSPYEQVPSLAPFNLIPGFLSSSEPSETASAKPMESDYSSLAPSVDQPNSAEETKTTTASAGKKGRSNSIFDPDRKARRAENNRRAAHESRQRKAQHVKELEAEVQSLRQLVDFYRIRLSRYELIEKHRNSFGYELYSQLGVLTNEMRTRWNSWPGLWSRLRPRCRSASSSGSVRTISTPLILRR